MPVAVICGSCDAKLNAPDAAAGKTVKCPKCGVMLVIPFPEPDTDFEVIEDDQPAKPRPATKAPPPAKPKSKPVVDDDDEAQPAPKKKLRPAVAEDDEDDRPAKKKGAKKPVVVDEDDAPRPKKKGAKGKKPTANGGNLPLWIGGGVGGLAVIGLLVWLLFLRGPAADKPGANNPPGPDGPRTGGENGPPADPLAAAPRLQPAATLQLPAAFKDTIPPTLSLDGRTLAVNVARDNVFSRGTVWDLSDKPTSLAEFKDPVLAITGDGVAACSGGFGGNGLIDVRTKKPLLDPPPTGSHLTFVSPERFVATNRSFDFSKATAGTVSIRDYRKKGDLSSFPVPDNRFSDVRVTNGGTRLWLFLSNKKFEVECWDIAGKQRLATVRPEVVDPRRPYTDAGTSTSVSADGAILTANLTLDRFTQVFFDAKTGKRIDGLPVGLDGSSVGFLPIGQVFVARVPKAAKAEFALYDFAQRKIIAVLPGAFAVASADGQRLVTFSGTEAQVFDLSSLGLK